MSSFFMLRKLLITTFLFITTATSIHNAYCTTDRATDARQILQSVSSEIEKFDAKRSNPDALFDKAKKGMKTFAKAINHAYAKTLHLTDKDCSYSEQLNNLENSSQNAPCFTFYEKIKEFSENEIWESHKDAKKILSELKKLRPSSKNTNILNSAIRELQGVNQTSQSINKLLEFYKRIIPENKYSIIDADINNIGACKKEYEDIIKQNNKNRFEIIKSIRNQERKKKLLELFELEKNAQKHELLIMTKMEGLKEKLSANMTNKEKQVIILNALIGKANQQNPALQNSAAPSAPLPPKQEDQEDQTSKN